MITSWKRLDKKQLKHLRESGVNYDSQAVETFRKQAVYRADTLIKGLRFEPCWDCYIISKALGYAYTLDVLRDWAVGVALDGYKVTRIIPKDQADKLQSILNLPSYDPESDRDGVIHTLTVKFPDRYEADIKVCNGDTPYVDAVLFDEHGQEVSVGEVTDTLLGEYHWQTEGIEYTAEIETLT